MVDAMVVVTKGSHARLSWEMTGVNDLPTFPPRMFFELRTVVTALGDASVVVPVAGGLQATRASKPVKLPPDTQTAVDVYRRLKNGHGEAIEFEQWRDATFAEWGDKTPGAKRTAWSKTQRLLGGLIVRDGNCVSVSAPSA
jgi:hypothetical protein